MAEQSINSELFPASDSIGYSEMSTKQNQWLTRGALCLVLIITSPVHAFYSSSTANVSIARIPGSFTYDFMGRRVSKQVETWTNSAYSTIVSNKFVYDGWNLVAELNGTNNTAIRTYLWGMDLSGSMQGAGGVGGLLAVKDTVNARHFAAYDGNGNVTGLFSAADGTTSAVYEYDPFGNLLRATGPMAKVSPFRFSTKYQDDETDWSYYGYRFYNASMGRWLSRDPIKERGGVNLHAFVGNDPVQRYDFLGKMIGYAHDKLKLDDCGAFYFESGFNIPNAIGEDGYIVQKIRFDLQTTAVTGGAKFSKIIEYWEAFAVKANSNFPLDDRGQPMRDQWAFNPKMYGTSGNFHMAGTLRFYPKSITGDLGDYGKSSQPPAFPAWITHSTYGDTPPIVPNYSAPEPIYFSSGKAPSIGMEPTFWDEPALETAIHGITRSWNCTCPLRVETGKVQLY